MHTCGEDARHVFEQAATGDVGEALDAALGQQGQHRLGTVGVGAAFAPVQEAAAGRQDLRHHGLQARQVLRRVAELAPLVQLAGDGAVALGQVQQAFGQLGRGAAAQKRFQRLPLVAHGLRALHGGGHLLARRFVRRRRLAAQLRAPGQGQGHLVLAEPALGGVGAIAIAGHGVADNPHLNLVRLRAFHGGRHAGQARIHRREGAYRAPGGIGLAAAEDGAAAGGDEGGVGEGGEELFGHGRAAGRRGAGIVRRRL